MIWNPLAECQSLKDRQRLQSDRLGTLVDRVYRRVPFYRQKMDALGIKPSDIQSIADIAKLPFTSKDELRQTYPYGLLACRREELVEIHTSSGTTGTPVVGAYTAADIELWSEVMGRTLTMAGCKKGDTVQNAYGYGLFTGGLGVHYGARKIGANVIPISSGNTRRQLAIMKDFGTTLLACTPSYALYMAESAREEGFDLKDFPLKAGCFGAEPWSSGMRSQIEASLGISAHDIYTDSRKSLAPVFQPSVPARKGSTSTKTCSIPKSLIRSPDSRSPTGKRENLSSPPSAAKVPL